MTADTKICPRCAEPIRTDATACRNCSYQYGPVAPQRSITPRQRAILIVLVVLAAMIFIGSLKA